MQRRIGESIFARFDPQNLSCGAVLAGFDLIECGSTFDDVLVDLHRCVGGDGATLDVEIDVRIDVLTEVTGKLLVNCLAQNDGPGPVQIPSENGSGCHAVQPIIHHPKVISDISIEGVLNQVIAANRASIALIIFVGMGDDASLKVQ